MSPRKRVAGAGLLALLAVLGLFALRPALLERLELVLLDWRFRVRGARAPVAPIAIAAIDAKSVDALGRWPWRRSVMADLLDRLGELGAVAVGVDVVFSEPEIPPETGTLRAARDELLRRGVDGSEALAVLAAAIEAADTDRRLEEAIARSGRVALGFFFRTGEQQAYDESVAPGALEAGLAAAAKAKVKVARITRLNQERLLTCTGVEPNLERFHRAAARVGFFSTDLDRDGVIRRAPLVGRCGGDVYVSLDTAVVELVSGARAMVLADPNQRLEVRLGEVVFPADEGGRILIDYRGPPRTFPHHPIVDILEGRVGREQIQGRVVLIGPTEAGIQDVYPTPFARAVPGIEIHANIIDNLIAGSVLRRDDGFLLAELAAILLIGGLLVVVLPRLGGAAGGALFALLLLAALVGTVTWFFATRGWWVNLAYPGTGLLLVYLTVAVMQSVTVEAQGRRIRRQFATYVSPQVADEMIHHPGSFRLGGERRDLSILFSDVAGFTTISEEIGAENVVELMNAYLNPMTRIVLDTRGTLDKYIGDALMAFWGAPLEVEDHPLRACQAALAMQEQVARLRREHAEIPGMQRLRVRIGIHSSVVVVGNMGSERRFDYTLTGDGVNVCARLEGLNKYYDTGILASGQLVDRLPPGFLVRELDEIRVKGKQQGVRIFEVIGARKASTAEGSFFAAYAEGLARYRAGEWAAAAAAFGRALALRDGSDGASALLLGRIEMLRAEPPGDWDGVWTFQTK